MLDDKCRLALITEKTGGHRHRAAGIQNVDYRLAIMRRNLDCCVRPACGCPADEQRQLEALTLHFARHMHHLVERWGDKAAESDEIRLLRFGTFEDLFAGDHDPHVDHLVVIAGEDDADDVLANIMHVALDRRQYDFPLRLDHFTSRSPGFLLRLHERGQVRYSLLHYTGGLDYLRQEHFAGAEQITDH